MDQIPTAQLFNNQTQPQQQPSPFRTPIPRPSPNSHKPPAHPVSNIPQPNNTWREIFSVSSKQLYPSHPPPPTPSRDTSHFVIVMYTTLTINPETSPKPQVEPARSLHSIAFPPHRPDPQVTHVNAVGGDGTITVSAAAPAPSAVPRPSYAPDNFYSDPHHQDRNFNCYTDRQPPQFPQDILPRPHDYPLSTNPLHTHDSHFQTHALPPQPAPLDHPRHTPYATHPEYTHPIHPLHSQPDTTALSRHPRVNPPTIFRNDPSIPPTPTTPATSATQPFSATPSSPDNNGASSNGSGTREHACTFPGCTKTFDRRYNLSVHYRRHTDEMPYPCKFPGCPQKFKWRSSQSHHMKTRHQVVGARRANRNNSYRRTGNTARVNGLAAAGTAISQLALTENNTMPQSHVPIIGLVADDENPGSYKRAFSPRKRTRTEKHAP